MQQPTPPVSAPLVWAELISSDVERVAGVFASALGWKAQRDPGTTNATFYLDHARMAGPICGVRPRTPNDVVPDGHEGAPPDRWTVRLSPPRPPQAADPAGDQLLRPRAPGPRIGRWASPSALCFAELFTDDVDGACDWMRRRLDANFTPAPGERGAQLLCSSVQPALAVAAILPQQPGEALGWVPAVQVASIAAATDRLQQAGVEDLRERPVPLGCVGDQAVEVRDPGGSVLTLVQHGPTHGRR